MMEWIISAALVLFGLFIFYCFKVDFSNYNYRFRDFNLMQKIARVIVYIILGIMIMIAFMVFVCAVKWIIFG